jgi:hypothetical protein
MDATGEKENWAFEYQERKQNLEKNKNRLRFLRQARTYLL